MMYDILWIFIDLGSIKLVCYKNMCDFDVNEFFW